MITVEQKKQLQFDARIPHLPTDLTYECRMAISGEGSREQDWSDKPHRLVYDLSRQVEADAVRIEQLEAKLTKAVAALEEVSAIIFNAVQGDNEHGVRALNEAAAKNYLKDFPLTLAAISEVQDVIDTALAELEGEE